MYDPKVGIFITPDPSEFEGGDTNLERYCGNDPIDNTDPSGLAAQSPTKDDARSAAEAGLRKADLPQQERRLRYDIVAAALGSKLRFPAGDAPAWRSREYWARDKEGEWRVEAGRGITAIENAWDVRGYTGGCYSLAEIVVLKGLATFCRQNDAAAVESGQKNPEMVRKFSQALEAGPPTRLFPNLKGATSKGIVADYFETAAAGGYPVSQLIPGDWVWFGNPAWTKAPNLKDLPENSEDRRLFRKNFEGEEGSNMFYAGNGIFVSYNGVVYSYAGAQRHITTGDEHSQNRPFKSYAARRIRPGQFPFMFERDSRGKLHPLQPVIEYIIRPKIPNFLLGQ